MRGCLTRVPDQGVGEREGGRESELALLGGPDQERGGGEGLSDWMPDQVCGGVREPMASDTEWVGGVGSGGVSRWVGGLVGWWVCRCVRACVTVSCDRETLGGGAASDTDRVSQ